MCKQYFYDFVNGFIVMKKIPIMWNVVKMCVIVFATVATTFIIAVAIQDQANQIWSSYSVLNIGSVIALGILIYYVVRIALIFKRNRQLKRTK